MTAARYWCWERGGLGAVVRPPSALSHRGGLQRRHRRRLYRAWRLACARQCPRHLGRDIRRPDSCVVPALGARRPRRGRAAAIGPEHRGGLQKRYRVTYRRRLYRAWRLACARQCPRHLGRDLRRPASCVVPALGARRPQRGRAAAIGPEPQRRTTEALPPPPLSRLAACLRAPVTRRKDAKTIGSGARLELACTTSGCKRSLLFSRDSRPRATTTEPTKAVEICISVKFFNGSLTKMHIIEGEG